MRKCNIAKDVSVKSDFASQTVVAFYLAVMDLTPTGCAEQNIIGATVIVIKMASKNVAGEEEDKDFSSSVLAEDTASHE